MNKILRNDYLKQIIDYAWDGQVKVITGIRRCGKSYLLKELYKDYLLGKGVDASHIIMISLDEAREMILTNNTPASFREIAEGKVDLIFCLHASADQEAYAKENGVTLEYTPFANDAFVFFVNKDILVRRNV